MRLSSNTIISSPLRVGLHAAVAVLHLAGLLRNLTSFSKFEFMRGKFGDVTPGVLDVYRTFVSFSARGCASRKRRRNKSTFSANLSHHIGQRLRFVAIATRDTRRQDTVMAAQKQLCRALWTDCHISL